MYSSPKVYIYYLKNNISKNDDKIENIATMHITKTLVRIGIIKKRMWWWPKMLANL